MLEDHDVTAVWIFIHISIWDLPLLILETEILAIISDRYTKQKYTTKRKEKNASGP